MPCRVGWSKWCILRAFIVFQQPFRFHVGTENSLSLSNVSHFHRIMEIRAAQRSNPHSPHAVRSMQRPYLSIHGFATSTISDVSRRKQQGLLAMRKCRHELLVKVKRCKSATSICCTAKSEIFNFSSTRFAAFVFRWWRQIAKGKCSMYDYTTKEKVQIE